jgi:hypothetical protein
MGLKVEGSKAAITIRGCFLGAFVAFLLLVKSDAAACLDLQTSNEVRDRYTPDPTSEERNCLLYIAPSDYIDLLMRVLVGGPETANGAYDATRRKYGNDWPTHGFTMVGTVRLENFRATILEVYRNGIPGSIFELGVWRGGAMILAAAVVKHSEVKHNHEKQPVGEILMHPAKVQVGDVPSVIGNRDLYVVDAFESITSYGEASTFLANSMDAVKGNFEFFGLLDPNVHFVKGLFKDSLPSLSKSHKGPIAVLRVEGNFYDSHQDAMYYLYPKVLVGGIVIFDDVMSHGAVMEFWKNFKNDYRMPEELNRIDTHSAWFRKEKNFAVDFTRMRDPRDSNKQS